MAVDSRLSHAIPVCYMLQSMHFMSLCCSKSRIALAVFKGSVTEAGRNDFVRLLFDFFQITNLMHNSFIL